MSELDASRRRQEIRDCLTILIVAVAGLVFFIGIFLITSLVLFLLR